MESDNPFNNRSNASVSGVSVYSGHQYSTHTPHHDTQASRTRLLEAQLRKQSFAEKQETEDLRRELGALKNHVHRLEQNVQYVNPDNVKFMGDRLRRLEIQFGALRLGVHRETMTNTTASAGATFSGNHGGTSTPRGDKENAGLNMGMLAASYSPDRTVELPQRGSHRQHARCPSPSTMSAAQGSRGASMFPIGGGGRDAWDPPQILESRELLIEVRDLEWVGRVDVMMHELTVRNAIQTQFLNETLFLAQEVLPLAQLRHTMYPPGTMSLAVSTSERARLAMDRVSQRAARRDFGAGRPALSEERVGITGGAAALYDEMLSPLSDQGEADAKGAESASGGEPRTAAAASSPPPRVASPPASAIPDPELDASVLAPIVAKQLMESGTLARAVSATAEKAAKGMIPRLVVEEHSRLVRTMENDVAERARSAVAAQVEAAGEEALRPLSRLLDARQLSFERAIEEGVTRVNLEGNHFLAQLKASHSELEEFARRAEIARGDGARDETMARSDTSEDNADEGRGEDDVRCLEELLRGGKLQHPSSDQSSAAPRHASALRLLLRVHHALAALDRTSGGRAAVDGCVMQIAAVASDRDGSVEALDVPPLSSVSDSWPQFVATLASAATGGPPGSTLELLVSGGALLAAITGALARRWWGAAGGRLIARLQAWMPLMLAATIAVRSPSGQSTPACDDAMATQRGEFLALIAKTEKSMKEALRVALAGSESKVATWLAEACQELRDESAAARREGSAATNAAVARHQRLVEDIAAVRSDVAELKFDRVTPVPTHQEKERAAPVDTFVTEASWESGQEALRRATEGAVAAVERRMQLHLAQERSHTEARISSAETSCEQRASQVHALIASAETTAKRHTSELTAHADGLSRLQRRVDELHEAVAAATATATATAAAAAAAAVSSAQRPQFPPSADAETSVTAEELSAAVVRKADSACDLPLAARVHELEDKFGRLERHVEAIGDDAGKGGAARSCGGEQSSSSSLIRRVNKNAAAIAELRGSLATHCDECTAELALLISHVDGLEQELQCLKSENEKRQPIWGAGSASQAPSELPTQTGRATPDGVQSVIEKLNRQVAALSQAFYAADRLPPPAAADKAQERQERGQRPQQEVVTSHEHAGIGVSSSLPIVSLQSGQGKKAASVHRAAAPGDVGKNTLSELRHRAITPPPLPHQSFPSWGGDVEVAAPDASRSSSATYRSLNVSSVANDGPRYGDASHASGWRARKEDGNRKRREGEASPSNASARSPRSLSPGVGGGGFTTEPNGMCWQESLRNQPGSHYYTNNSSKKIPSPTHSGGRSISPARRHQQAALDGVGLAEAPGDGVAQRALVFYDPLSPATKVGHAASRVVGGAAASLASLSDAATPFPAASSISAAAGRTSGAGANSASHPHHPTLSHTADRVTRRLTGKGLCNNRYCSVAHPHPQHGINVRSGSGSAGTDLDDEARGHGGHRAVPEPNRRERRSGARRQDSRIRHNRTSSASTTSESEGTQAPPPPPPPPPSAPSRRSARTHPSH